MKKFFGFIVSAALGLSACSQKEPIPVVGSKTVDEIELKNILYSDNIHGYNEIIDDVTYCVTTKEWVRDYFYPKFRKELFDKGLSKAHNESWDCDDFALKAKVLAQELNHQSLNKGRAALAVGKLNFVKEGLGKHAVNIFLIEDNDKIILMFLEPQNGSIYKLSKEEKLSTLSFHF